MVHNYAHVGPSRFDQVVPTTITPQKVAPPSHAK
jgi:hypothetical protein